MDLKYEKATAEDIECIFELSKRLIDDYENIEDIDYDKVLKWVHKKIEDNIDEYTCVFANGEKAGYYHFLQSEDQLYELDDLYIFPTYQNQGIGTKIITKCCEEAKCPVFLYVFIKNERAISLYARLGFRVVETIRDSRYIMRNDRKEAFTLCEKTDLSDH